MKLLNLFIYILISSSLVSCAFKAEEEEQANNTSSIELGVTDLSLLDSDGDLISDAKELENGRNPYVADLPILKSRFLQNYKIEFTRFSEAEGKEEVVIDTSVYQGNPDFKYRVGEIFARENAFDSAARVGKFSSHSSGSIENRDLTWIKFPEVDQKYFLRTSLDLNEKGIEEAYITSTKVTLENSLKLQSNGAFKVIKNLEVSFYYYNYQTENYELLDTAKIERHFKAGVNEVFTVELNEVPIDLITDNYLTKGEFIISEITDFEIPELQTTYKSLMASVKAKTVPLVFNTPLESHVFYIAVKKDGSSFIEVMSNVFKENFEITENVLTKVDQFSSNLGDFTYLKEMKDKDKLGKWFVFTREIQSSYLDHKFKRGEPLVASYITGTELSSRSEEKIYTQNYSMTGGESFKVIPLGNISPNSSVDVHVRPERKTGTNITKEVKINDVQGMSCGTNCIQREIYCRWEINTLNPFDIPLDVNKSLAGDLKQLSLMINDQEFNLEELVKQKFVSVSWPTNNLLHLSIADVSKIAEINNFEENVMSLKIESSVKNDFVGIKLTNVDRYWKGDGGCPQYTVTQGAIWGVIPLSTESIHLDRIQNWANDLNEKFKPNVSWRGRENFYDQIFISVSSLINNFHN